MKYRQYGSKNITYPTDAKLIIKIRFQTLNNFLERRDGRSHQLIDGSEGLEPKKVVKPFLVLLLSRLIVTIRDTLTMRSRFVDVKL